MRISVSAIVFAALLATGCSVGPRLENVYQMALPLDAGSRFNGNTPLAGRVVLGTVATFEKKWLMGGDTYARIEEFKDALKHSLEDAQLTALGNPGFTLNAVVTRAEADQSGDTFTVGVNYSLVPVAGGAAVVQRSIITSHTATGGDPNQEGAPKDLARNGAFRMNIEQAFDMLYRVKLR